MRTVGASGHGPSMSMESDFLQQSATGPLPLLLDGLNRLRPELGPLADELIGLLSGDAIPADNLMPGTQD